MLNASPWVVLDEPFASLDESAAQEIGALLKNHVELSGATTVLVTHDPHDARKLARKIIAHGSPASSADVHL